MDVSSRIKKIGINVHKRKLTFESQETIDIRFFIKRMNILILRAPDKEL